MTITTSLVKVFQFANQREDIQNEETEKITQQTLDIALYCIPFHLRNSMEHEKLEGLPKSYLIPPCDPSPLVQRIAQLCIQMRSENTLFFENLPKMMDLELMNAKELYMRLCKEVFRDGVKNWGRILSIFTLACEIATHFAKNNKKNIIINIPMWVRDFVSEHLVDWIIQQGGWEEMTKHLSYSNGSKPWSGLIACTGLVVAAGYLVLIKGLGRN